MLNTAMSPWPSFSQEEADAVSKVLLSNKVNYWTGNEGRLFEKEFAQFSDSKYAVAVANGTLAIDLALRSLAIGQGDEVIVTSRTFIASISCIINAGATPVFADIDLDSQNITANTIQAVLSQRTKAIICVHLAGWPCDMDPIMSLAKKHQLYVIEDCAQAHGTKYKGKSVGSIGDVGAWSFCQDKIMTTGGEGGMLTTNNETLWRTAWAFKDHGKSYAAVYEKSHPPGYRWLHESFGTNWRLTEMQSTIGRIQLTKMPEWQQLRTRNAEKIFATCQQFPFLHVPEIPPYIEHAFYKCYVFIKPELLPKPWEREQIISAINEQEVPCFSGSCSEVYLEKAFDNKPYRPEKPLKNAQQLGATSLMFLVHPTLTIEEINKTCQVIEQICNKIADS
ncbi:DegT/DnrJ/EryC1/StrS aminotransferase family protein [Thalassotalea sp. 1_MG-2023]|uniref:DegT/DnrJ/EryC1/StrS family aminotransferase n=1 Tax=Thalassotalea sp. 1_MG-2023 TaxID=3062680 RepID=UPI0026E30FE4|nr:DegT/DnrJ/EryC1/StrS aminotransferase family protein [Thalassotalea sp. 1_MG-2023]MDO6425528.1 DegT/DnrJ/EryC1/StrS aminotransferase family protein [Thalassotalea sp. 1_MG-2023]